MSHIHITLADEPRLIHTPDDRAWNAMYGAWEAAHKPANGKDAYHWRPAQRKQLERLSFAASIHLQDRWREERIASGAIHYCDRLIEQHWPPVAFSEMKTTPSLWLPMRKKK